MRINPKGIALIKEFEGCKLQTYHDQNGIPTIGYGHTGSDVKEGMTITQTQAEQLLIHDIERTEEIITPHIQLPIGDDRYSALVVFAYNVGPGNLINSTLLKLINEGHYEAAAAQFMHWVHVGDRISEGLVRRRKAEQALFESKG
jgi:lysozyme